MDPSGCMGTEIYLQLYGPNSKGSFRRKLFLGVHHHCYSSRYHNHRLVTRSWNKSRSTWYNTIKIKSTFIIYFHVLGFSEPNKVQTLFLLVRQHFVTKYKIRRAVEEDNDDLVPLIHIDSERLQEIYGEFYIGEILTRHCDSGRQLIVAEYAEHAVAVLCLNAAINDELLNQAFELIPFYGLRKAHPEDDIEHADLSAEISTMGISVGDEEQMC